MIDHIQYGQQTIMFTHQIDPKLKNAYITVDFYEGVILKSPQLSPKDAQKLVKKKARWIIDKLKLVAQVPVGDIVSGSRVLYLGKRYYAKLIQNPDIKSASIKFVYSRFNIAINPEIKEKQIAIQQAFNAFYREKSIQKITPRINLWVKTTGLIPKSIQFRKLNKRWGSCTQKDEIIINFDAIKLPYSLIDYIIVHELSHIRHKDHSAAFWREVEKYIPDYLELNEKMVGMKL